MTFPERFGACAFVLASLLLPFTSSNHETSTDVYLRAPENSSLIGEETTSISTWSGKGNEMDRTDGYLFSNGTSLVWSSSGSISEANRLPITQALTPASVQSVTEENNVSSTAPGTTFPSVPAPTSNTQRKKSKSGNRQKQGGRRIPQTELSTWPVLASQPRLNKSKQAERHENMSTSSGLQSEDRTLDNKGPQSDGTRKVSLNPAFPTTAPLNDPPWFHGGESPFYSRGSGSSSDGLKGKQDVNRPVVDIPEDPFAEPTPDWVAAKAQWGLAWQIHIFAAGPLFAVLAAYSLISLLRVRSFIRLLGRGYFISLNVLLLIIGVARSVFLLLDGYNSAGRFPAPLAYFFLNIGYPCLSSAFAILFLALLRATRVQLLPAKVQRPGVLSAAVVFHFSFSVSADVIVGSMEDTAVLLFACQLLFALWCLALACGYFYIFRRLHKAALRKQGEMIRITFTKLHIDGARLPRKLPRPTLALAVRVTLVTAVLSVAAALLQVYGMVFVYGVFPARKPDPWPWWGYQFSSRVIELCMCAALSFVATQPLRDYEEQTSAFLSKLLSCKRLTPSCCRCKEDTDSFDAYLETHSSGFRNSGFSHSLDGHTARRGNSLPSFRPLPLADPDIGCDGLPMQHGGARGGLLRHDMTAGGSLQNGHHQRGGGRGLTDGISVPGALNATTSSESRPTSMLFKDKGFIRFRSEGDPEQPMDLSDATTEEEPQGSPSTWGSIKAEAGSSGRQSLCEDDFVQSSLSPFFQHAYRQHQLQHRFKRFSRCSLETLDNNSGGDVSSEQLSNVVPFSHNRPQHGLSNSALDFHMMHRKYGSTCSSESAANSFDVTFYLQQSMLVSPHQLIPSRDAPPSQQPPSQPPLPTTIRSISPIATRAVASARRFQGVPLNLDLSRDGLLSCGLVNVACGTEDVTPDSAVYLDLHLSRECDEESPPETSPPESTSPPAPAHSHSLNDLTGWRLGTSRCKRSLSFLNRLKGSSFSLNASLHGYEPLGSGDENQATVKTGKDSIRTIPSQPKNFTSLSDMRPELGVDLLPQVDSGLLGDCREQVIQVDRASQTETSSDVPKDSLIRKGEFINGIFQAKVIPLIKS